MDEQPIIVGKHESHDTYLKLWPLDRQRHFYCVGKTGTGKSTLQFNMVMQDLTFGHGVCLIDPHGAFAEKVLRHFPRHRARDLVYLNPADPTHSVGLNPLDVPERQRELAASHVVSILKARWADSWGPSLEEILGNSVLALMYTPGATFLCVPRLLSDKDYRKRVVSRVSDSTVRSFWEQRFASWSPSMRETKTEPVLNKVGQFLSAPATRHIFVQSKSTFDLRFMMDNRKVLIANLSSGAVGEDHSNLIGAFLISKIFLTALSRVTVLEDALEASEEEIADELEQYPNFYLFVDEFQNFTTASTERILSEARKYKLPISLSHQYIEQLTPEIQKAVFGNVGSLASFQVGSTDAQRLAPELDSENQVAPGHLTGLASYRAYVKLLVDGQETQAVRMRTFAPYESGCKDRRRMLIASSRQRFATERTKVEERLSRWFTNGQKKTTPTTVKNPARKSAAGIHLHLHMPSEGTAEPSGWKQLRAQGREERMPRNETTHPKCPHCDRHGRLFLRTQADAVLSMPCPHDVKRIEALVKEKGLRRM